MRKNKFVIYGTYDTDALHSTFPPRTTTSSISRPDSNTDELVHAKLKIECSGLILLFIFDIDRANFKKNKMSILILKLSFFIRKIKALFSVSSFGPITSENIFSCKP